MEIWRILLIILVIILLLALVYSFLYTLKSRTIADYQAFEKPARVIDQTQNSYSIMPSQYIKRPSGIQKDFIDSFMELSKEPASSTALASTSILPDKPRAREEGEGLPRSDRSIDFLLATTTTRRGYSKRGHNPEHTHLEVNRLKMKKDLERAQYDITEDIARIEKEVASIPGVQLFKTHIWKDFLHYHYLIALFFRYQRIKPVRHHILYNSSLYLIVLYIMSFLASGLGPDSLKNFSLIAIGSLILVAFLLLVIYSVENTEDECLAADLMPELRVGEEQADERTNALLMISQKRFMKEVVSKLICILGLAGGISMFSRLSKLDPEVTGPLFGGFMIVVVLDITVWRNILIVVLTGSLGSVIRKKIVKERVRELAEKRALQPNTSALYGSEANKKLFTIQQDARENYVSSHYSDVKDIRRLWSKDRINLDTNSNEPDETDERRGRMMSFSDKDRPEVRTNTVSSEAHVEDTTSRHRDSPPKEVLKHVNSSFSTSSSKNARYNMNTPTDYPVSRPTPAKFSIFIPINRLGVGMVDEELNQKKITEDSVIRASIEEHLNARSNTIEDDKASHKRFHYSQTLSKGLDTGKLFREDEESKEFTHGNYTHQTQHTQMEPESEDRHTRFNHEEIYQIQQEVPEEITEEIVEDEQVQTQKREYREGDRAEKLFGELEAEMDESIGKRRTQKVEEPEPLPPAKEEEQPSENKASEPTNHVTMGSQEHEETMVAREVPVPRESIRESLKQASIASAKKALANFKPDWFESLSLEKKEDDVVMPNAVVEAEMKKEEERAEIKVQPMFVKENNVHASDTSLSLPNSLAYLDHEKSSVNYVGSQNEAERTITLKKLISRKESILSQEEFRYEVENFVKNFPKAGGRKSRNNNVSDSENEGDISKHELQPSTYEYGYRRSGKKEPLRENRFALQEREFNRESPKHVVAQVESYPELQDEFVKGTEWVGYDTQMAKKQHRSQKQLPSYEERKSKMLQEEMEKNNRKKRTTQHSKGFLMPQFNLDKLSEVSRSYGFKIQQKGTGASNQDLIISRLEQKRKSASVEKPDEEFLEHRKLPRVTKSSVRSQRRISVEDKREVKSLNKLASLPEIKEVINKHY